VRIAALRPEDCLALLNLTVEPDPERLHSAALTFAATLCRTELFSYEQSIFYTIVAAVIALPRTELKAKVDYFSHVDVNCNMYC